MGIRKIWIGELIYKIENELQQFVDTDHIVKKFTPKFIDETKNYFISNNNGYFDPKLCDKLLSESETLYRDNEMSRDKFVKTRWMCQYLTECFYEDTIVHTKLPRLGHQNLSSFFADIIEKYTTIEEKKKILSPQVIKARRITVRILLFFLQNRGHNSFETVDSSDIRAFIPFIAKKQPKGIVHTLPIIRKFCALLDEEKIYTQKWATILNIKQPRSTVVQKPFTNGEISKLLNSPDRNTPIGLRDYAMILLSAATGVRSIDIINLKLLDIDWRANEIMIVQRKTGKPLRLPLLPEVGNAISEYILKGRPKSSSKYVFVSTIRPYGKLSNDGNLIVQKHMRKVGIHDKEGQRRGFHSFRRAVGSFMLEAEVPIEIISGVLGHSSTEATKPYLSIDFIHLKECALTFSEFPCLRGELL